VSHVIEQFWMIFGALDEVVGMRRETERYECEAGILEMPDREAEGNLRTCHCVNLYQRLCVEKLASMAR
jgi:hypothetical protein